MTANISQATNVALGPLTFQYEADDFDRWMEKAFGSVSQRAVIGSSRVAPLSEPSPDAWVLQGELDRLKDRQKTFLENAYFGAIEAAEKNEMCGEVEKALEKIGVPLLNRDVEFKVTVTVRGTQVGEAGRKLPSAATIRSYLNSGRLAEETGEALFSKEFMKDISIEDAHVSEVTRINEVHPMDSDWEDFGHISA